MHDFRGASADALHALSEELRGVADADLMRVGEDLFAVALLLRGEPALRRVATDVSVPEEARRSLVRQVLDTKVAPAALDLSASAAGRRWTVARDFADALERLSEIAIVRSAGDRSERLADELFAVGETVRAAPELRDALSDPARNNADKSRLVADLLQAKALPETVVLAQHAVAGSYRTVSVALATYQKVAAETVGERVATVTVAKPLAEADRDRLRAVLSRQYGRNVHLNVVVDPQVIGGVRVEIGDDVIDGTVVGRLDTARRRLAG